MSLVDLARAGTSAHPAAEAAERSELPVVFTCEGDRLLGIVHHAAGTTGVVIIVGGPQYRAGSHRHFVQLARSLAAAGHPVLRFDARGMGDSSGPLRGFEHTTPDVGAAIDALFAQQPHSHRVVLCGLCDGASAALLYLCERSDPRVAGVCLINPWVRSAVTLARTQVKHYYRRRLMQLGFWRKLLSGNVARSALCDLVAAVRALPGRKPPLADTALTFHHRMAAGWHRHRGPILVVLSGNDYTAREFEEFVNDQAEWSALMRRDHVQLVKIAEADHTFSGNAHARQAENALREWLARQGWHSKHETGALSALPRQRHDAIHPG